MTYIDLAGIGIGPFNLGLAALLNDHADLSSLFFERKPEFRWHSGMLLPGTTLQVPFLADLVSMAQPTHRLSYLNYLHEHDRLFQFYYNENTHVPRLEYDHYCRWAAQQLPNCHFAEAISDVHYDAASQRFVLHSESLTGLKRQYSSQHLAIGIGTVPYLPAWARSVNQVPLLHSAQFAEQQAMLQRCQRVTVIGSGQSAAECVLALFQALTPERVAAGASIQWLTRAPGFHPMEYSKLGQECFTPAYMDYFHSLPRATRREVVQGQGLLYKGISFSTIADIHDLLYQRSIGGHEPGLALYSNCAVEGLAGDMQHGWAQVQFVHQQLKQRASLATDAVVLATGYQHAWPQWFERLKGSVLACDEQGDCLVDENFCAQRIDNGAGKIFVHNAEIFQHGVGSPDLGLGAGRNAHIINQLLGHPHYRLLKRSAFQHYGMPPAKTRH